MIATFETGSFIWTQGCGTNDGDCRYMRNALWPFVRSKTKSALNGTWSSLSRRPPEPMKDILCNICGSEGPFADPTGGSNLRESLQCAGCGSKSRDRMLIYALSLVLGRSDALSQWPANQKYRIFETAGYRGHPPFLAEKYDYYNTKYDPEKIAAGADPRRYADIQQLPYADNFFDCVLSSDVFEHVRLDHQGFREILRVLKPGGILILQAPYGHIPHTRILVRPNGDKDEFLEPPQYHAENTLVYRIYGYDLLDLLRSIGFSVTRFRISVPRHQISEQDTFVLAKGSYTQFKR